MNVVVSYMSYHDNVVLMRAFYDVSSLEEAVLNMLKEQGSDIDNTNYANLELEELIEECFNGDIAIGVLEID